MPFMVSIFEADPKLEGKQGECFVAKDGDMMDNGVISLMADYTVCYRTCFHQEYDLFSVEVKPPSKSSNGQRQSDLVKLGKEMKRMVDCLVDAGIENIAVCGMLVQGFRCETYTMDLKFDGIYRMTQLAHFHLLRDSSDFLLAPQIIENLLQVKRIILDTVTSIDKRNKDATNRTTTTPRSRKRSACGIPKQIR